MLDRAIPSNRKAPRGYRRRHSSCVGTHSTVPLANARTSPCRRRPASRRADPGAAEAKTPRAAIRSQDAAVGEIGAAPRSRRARPSTRRARSATSSTGNAWLIASETACSRERRERHARGRGGCAARCPTSEPGGPPRRRVRRTTRARRGSRWRGARVSGVRARGPRAHPPPLVSGRSRTNRCRRRRARRRRLGSRLRSSSIAATPAIGGPRRRRRDRVDRHVAQALGAAALGAPT